MNEEFYIGYNTKMPAGTARFIRITIVLLFSGAIGIALVLSVNQRGFLESTYEYYQDTELTGYIISEPVPALKVSWGHDLSDNALEQTIPIVDFGKKGGQDLIRDFVHSRVQVRGKLIYYDGKALLELTGPDPITPQGQAPSEDPPITDIRYDKTAKFTGEIVDAKCFFGVMKPGHGKPHRSCAIRCISGGIPAVLRSRGENGIPDYHIIVNPMNLSQYVGESILVTGSEGNLSNWKMLKIEDITSLGSIDGAEINQNRRIALCAGGSSRLKIED